MAFEAVRPMKQYQKNLVISAGVYVSKDKAAIAIDVGQELMDQCGWVIGDKIEVAEGTERDNCLLQLRKGKFGFTLSRRGGSDYKKENGTGGGSIRVGVKNLIHHELRVDQAALQPVNFQRFGSAITVDLQDLIQQKPQAKFI